MSKCKKVKNPCKICLATVHAKDGLQCQGACESWVHYSCLNYTPGKIKDIKDGIIHITCPCPDCKTSVPKEYQNDPPFSCNNIMCPANNPPACEEVSCQANELSIGRPPPVLPPGTLDECGTKCKRYMMPTTYSSDMSDPCMEGFTVHTVPDIQKNPMFRGEPVYSNQGHTPAMPTLSNLEQMCQTVGELSSQLNQLMTKMKHGMSPVAHAVKGCGRGGCGRGAGMNTTTVAHAHSSGRLATGGGAGVGCGGGTCGTDGPPYSNCSQRGTKDMCPKPCYCPGNPVRRDA